MKDIVKSFQLLVESGYVEMIKPIASNQELDDLEQQKKERLQDDGIQGGEYEFEMNEDGTIVGERKNSKKKRTRSKSVDGDKATTKSKKKQKTAHGEHGTSSVRKMKGWISRRASSSSNLILPPCFTTEAHPSWFRLPCQYIHVSYLTSSRGPESFCI